MAKTNLDELELATGLGAASIGAGAVTAAKIGAAAVAESKLAAPNADGLHASRVARIPYDFAVDGGAIGNIDLPVTLPDKAIILDGLYDVVTTFTTAGADAGTIALTMGAQAANMLVVAIAVSNGANAWDAGLHDIVPVGTAATAVKLTAARAVRIVIGGQAVTAGKLIGFLRYLVSA
jgi:hypothetical protein